MVRDIVQVLLIVVVVVVAAAAVSNCMSYRTVVFCDCGLSYLHFYFTQHSPKVDDSLCETN